MKQLAERPSFVKETKTMSRLLVQRHLLSYIHTNRMKFLLVDGPFLL